MQMDCPSCKSGTRVVETRSASGGVAVRRRRECPACGTRFTTFERLAPGAPVVVKRDGGREPFDRDKLRRALVGAAHKRPVSRPEIDRIVDRVEARIGVGGGELTSSEIGELVLGELLELDYGAYLQFAGTMPDVNPEFAALRPVGSVRAEEEGS
jgi:transcriptional repressor NrdR